MDPLPLPGRGRGRRATRGRVGTLVVSCEQALWMTWRDSPDSSSQERSSPNEIQGTSSASCDALRTPKHWPLGRSATDAMTLSAWLGFATANLHVCPGMRRMHVAHGEEFWTALVSRCGALTQMQCCIRVAGLFVRRWARALPPITFTGFNTARQAPPHTQRLSGHS